MAHRDAGRLATLPRWDEQPHVVAADPDDDWGWEQDPQRRHEWRERSIAERDGRPLGFVQIASSRSSFAPRLRSV